MNADQIRSRIDELASHFTFYYLGKYGGVDPINRKHFDLWYGDDAITVHSLDEVMNIAFFDGKALKDITDQIEIDTI